MQSTHDTYKVLVNSPADLKLAIQEGECVRVRGNIDFSQQIPTIRLPSGDPDQTSAVLCTTEVEWW